MPRYGTRTAKPRAWDMDEDEPFRPYLEVSDSEAVETGLVTIDGEAILRFPIPIGFGRDGEW